MGYIYKYIYNAHLASVRFERSVCCGSLMTTYIYIYMYIYIYILQSQHINIKYSTNIKSIKPKFNKIPAAVIYSKASLRVASWPSGL